MPGSITILSTAVGTAFDPQFWTHLLATLSETAVATAVSLTIGGPVGLLLGTFQVLRRMFEAPIDGLRSIPATALFPLMLLVFGVGASTRIGIAVFGATFLSIVTVMYGAAAVDQDRLRHARRAGFSAWAMMRHIVAWEALPSLLAASRLAISASLVLVVVAEMYIGANRGLGYLVTYYQARYATPEMYAVIVLTGAAGYVANRVFKLGETVAQRRTAVLRTGA
jgi:NitT/TauT family transport system permease protein